MNNILITFIVLTLLILASCSSAEQEAASIKTISAAAKATKHEDGTISVSEPSKNDIESLKAFSSKLQDINAKHPKRVIDPQKIRAFLKVEKVFQDGTLLLEDGKIIGFAGCNCGDIFTEYLRKTFTDENTQVYYLDTGYTNKEILYSYVWKVDVDFGEGIGTKKVPVGPTFSLLNEVAIINKWCQPIEQQGHHYYDRYLALSKVGRKF